MLKGVVSFYVNKDGNIIFYALPIEDLGLFE